MAATPQREWTCSGAAVPGTFEPVHRAVSVQDGSPMWGGWARSEVPSAPWDSLCTSPAPRGEEAPKPWVPGRVAQGRGPERA